MYVFKLLSISVTLFYFIYFILFIGHVNIRNNVTHSFPYFWSLYPLWNVSSMRKDLWVWFSTLLPMPRTCLAQYLFHKFIVEIFYLNIEKWPPDIGSVILPNHSRQGAFPFFQTRTRVVKKTKTKTKHNLESLLHALHYHHVWLMPEMLKRQVPGWLSGGARKEVAVASLSSSFHSCGWGLDMN